jgi:1-acyl-sn-glycerol-3-phosphate acyltransferase
VALNSGLYWPAHGFVRRPGTIVVEFLPAIGPGLSKDAFMTELETRIESASTALLGETGKR